MAAVGHGGRGRGGRARRPGLLRRDLLPPLPPRLERARRSWRRSAGARSGRRGPSSTTAGTDPKELDNVYDRHRERRRHPDRPARGHEPADQAGDEPTPGKIDPEALERLRALGYVGARLRRQSRRAALRPAARSQGPDPARCTSLQAAQALRDAGRLDEAARLLEELARKDPGNPEVPFTLASVYFRLKNVRRRDRGRPPRARSSTRTTPIAVLDLALSYQAAGRLDEAIAGFERTLELLPDNVKALLNLAEIHYARGEREKAFDYYQRARESRAHGSPLVHVNLGTLALEMKRLDVAEDGAARRPCAGRRAAPASTSTWESSPSSGVSPRWPCASIAPRSRPIPGVVQGLGEPGPARATGREGRAPRSRPSSEPPRPEPTSGRALPHGGDPRRSRAPRRGGALGAGGAPAPPGRRARAAAAAAAEPASRSLNHRSAPNGAGAHRRRSPVAAWPLSRNVLGSDLRHRT